MRIVGVDWWLDVRFRERSFSGKVSIAIEGCADPLVVDAVQLTIESATLDGRPVPFRVDAAKGTVQFSGVSPEPHRLDLIYRGAADPNSLVGLYTSPSGPGYVLTTMLFPTGSGRLLPSFEHPAVKTVYRLTLTTDPGLTAIFNTALRAERTVDGRQERVFEPTPRMSAYLLYLGIGPFETLTVPGDRWSVTVAASPGRASAGRYCAERATELLAEYETYYGAPYPLSKLDLIALENFWAGAMENWGAIACRETAVLVDPTSSVRQRRGILTTLSHEIAHQWFGNLVTPAWWDDFWLNESFATFVSHRIIARRYPEEDTWTSFLIGSVNPAFEQDALVTTHPIHVPVDSPETLGEVSDSITYGKGASVLRMIEAYLGEETFRRGISAYLAKHQYDNARAEDLWSALGAASNLPVERIMSEWVTRPGHPVVHAHWADGTLSLRQERFVADGRSSEGRWPIPLRIASDGNERSLLFDGAELTLPLRSPKGLRIDPGRMTFSRTHYDASLFDAMVSEFPTMAPVDQWGFVLDAHAFVYAGIVPLQRFLDVVRAGMALTDALPVRALTSALSDLHNILYDVPSFVTAEREYLHHQLGAIGLETRSQEPDAHRLLRELLAANLAFADPQFAHALAPRFAEFERLPAELRSAVTSSYAIDVGSGAFDLLVDRLRSATRDVDRIYLVQGLASFQDPTIFPKVLALIPGPGITPSRALELLWRAATNPAGRSELFAWYQAHAAMLSKLWAGTPLQSLFLRVAIPMVGLEAEEAVTQYFTDHAPPEARQAVEQGLECSRLGTRLRRTVREGVPT